VGEADHCGASARDPGVARVQRELERFRARGVGPEDRLQIGEERVRVVDVARLRRPSRTLIT
jgi:hypothetical protein